MKAIDILILLKKISSVQQDLSMRGLADSLSISTSSVSECLERSKNAHLVDDKKKVVNTLALKEFLIHGIMYVFPSLPGRMTRGVPTYVSASPIKEMFVVTKEEFVWPSATGNMRGQTIKPIYPTVPNVVKDDETLYKLLVIVDVLRIGGAREKEIAIVELDKIFDYYDQNKH